MTKSILCLAAVTLLYVHCAAQQWQAITATSGSQDVSNNTVKIMAINKPRTGGGACGINDYWIGYGARNSYRYDFATPVAAVRVRLTTINTGELIAFVVNGEQYNVSSADLKPFDGDCFNVPLATVDSGKVSSKSNYANAALVISPRTPIQSLEIKHLNGDKGGAGTIYDIALPSYTENAADGATGIGDIVPTGQFSMSPNPAVKGVELRYMPVTNGTASIVITDIRGRKMYETAFAAEAGKTSTQRLPVEQFAPGSYIVDLAQDGVHINRKLVKL